MLFIIAGLLFLILLAIVGGKNAVAKFLLAGILLIAAGLLLILVTRGADAADKAETSTFHLLCVPQALNHRERDPVVRIFVTVTYDPLDLKVVHETYAGNDYDRGHQYINTNVKAVGAGDNVDNKVIWAGSLIRDPRRSIVGAVILQPSDRAFYTEAYYRNGALLGTMISNCTLIGNENEK